VIRSKCAQAELELEGWREGDMELRLAIRGEVKGEARLATDLSSGEVNLMRNGLIFTHLNLLEVEGGHKVEYITRHGSGEWSYQLNRQEEVIHFEASWVKEKTKFAMCNLNISLHEMLASASLNTWLSEGSWLHHLLGFHRLGLESSWSAQNRTLVSAEQVIRVDGQSQPVARLMLNSSSGLEMVWRGGEGSRHELNLAWTLHPCFGWRAWHCFSSFGGFLNIFKGDTRILHFGLKSLWAGGQATLGFDILGPEKRNLVHLEVSLPEPASPNQDKSEIRVSSNLPGLEQVFQVTGDESGHWRLQRGGALLASAQLQTLDNATILMKLPHNESLELVVAAVDSGVVNLLLNFTSEWESKRLSGRLGQVMGSSGGWSLMIEGSTPQFGDFSLARCLHLEQNVIWLCGEDQVSRGPFSLLSPFLSLLRVGWTPQISLTGWAGRAGGPEWGFEGGMRQGVATFQPDEGEINSWDRKARCSG